MAMYQSLIRLVQRSGRIPVEAEPPPSDRDVPRASRIPAAAGMAGTLLVGPQIGITPEAYARLKAYVESCSGEVSGFGSVRIGDEGRLLVIEEVFLVRQRCTPASTVIEPADLAAFLDEMLESGEDPGALRLYWHSHGDLAVFWSGTDLQTMETAFPQADWVLSLVLNRRGDLKVCLNLQHPIAVRIDDLPVHLHVEADPGVRLAIMEEVRQKVRSGWGGETKQIEVRRMVSDGTPRVVIAEDRRANDGAWPHLRRPDA